MQPPKGNSSSVVQLSTVDNHNRMAELSFL